MINKKYAAVIAAAFIFFNIMVHMGAKGILKKHKSQNKTIESDISTSNNPMPAYNPTKDIAFLKTIDLCQNLDSFLALLFFSEKKKNPDSSVILMGSSMENNNVLIKVKGKETQVMNLIMKLEKNLKNGYLKSIEFINEKQIFKCVFTLNL